MWRARVLLARVCFLALGLVSAPLWGTQTASTPGGRGLGATPIFPGAAGITFIDAHDHIHPGLLEGNLIEVMDRLGITKIVVMGQARSVDATAALAVRAFEKYPDRVIPFVGLNFMDTVSRDALEALDRLLASRRFLGMGELHGRHYGFVGRLRSGRDITIPLDSPGAQDIMCLATKHNVVLTIHMETTADTLPRLERALRRNPNAKIIWAHQNHLKTFGGPEPENARKAEPEQLAALFIRHPNLYADLAPGLERRFLTDADRWLPDPWRRLYERFNDRFVAGLDNAFPENWRDVQGVIGLSVIASVIKDWLAQLSPATRRNFAQDNFERILAPRAAAVTSCEFRT